MQFGANDGLFNGLLCEMPGNPGILPVENSTQRVTFLFAMERIIRLDSDLLYWQH